MQPITCTNCGKSLREGVEFCPGCGAAVGPTHASLESGGPSFAQTPMAATSAATCGSCGKPLRKGVVFCPGCGSAVVIAEAQAVSAEAPTQSDASPVTPPTRAGAATALHFRPALTWTLHVGHAAKLGSRRAKR
jgi:uncharacterized Zn finger protein (UPF0148 family)